MMSSKIRVPSFTLVFDDKWRYTGSRVSNGDECFASLKASVQSTRGYLCRPVQGLISAGVLDQGGAMTDGFVGWIREMIGKINGSAERQVDYKDAMEDNADLGAAPADDADIRAFTIRKVCSILYAYDRMNGQKAQMVNPKTFFKTIKAKSGTTNTLNNAMGSAFMPDAEGEAAFGGGAVMGALDTTNRNTWGFEGDDKTLVFNLGDIAKWYFAGMSLPLVTAFVNWGVCYTGQGIALSSGKVGGGTSLAQRCCYSLFFTGRLRLA